MLCAVIGNGPRTGTSFVMRKLHEAGLPVVWDASLNIPGADYDIMPEDVLRVEYGIVKTWPIALRSLSLHRAVVLRRDHAAQMRSVYEQQAREDAAQVKLHEGEADLVAMVTAHQRALNRWLLDSRHKTEVLDIRTEDLDGRTDEIIDWFAAVFQRRAA
jgi:hypothetical protein